MCQGTLLSNLFDLLLSAFLHICIGIVAGCA